jgi:UDP-glucose 4-epimerase
MSERGSVTTQYRDARVLITGGLGLIGSHLARTLTRIGAAVTVIDSLDPRYGGNRFNISDIDIGIDLHIADIRDIDRLTRLLERQDYVFNLAAQTSHVDSMTDPRTDLEINAGAQLALVEACRHTNPRAKIVFTSTRQVYGRPQYLPVDERHPVQPPDVNGINKLAGEQYHLLYQTVYGVRACVLRLTNTFGPGMRVKDARQTFIGIWIRNLLEGNPIPVFGDGRQRRDFLYVEDCVNALLLAGASAVADGKTYNVGDRKSVSLAELAELMTTLGFGGRVEHLPYPEERAAIDIGDYYTDHSSITRDLGWRPTVRLADGLKKTLMFYKENLANYL